VAATVLTLLRLRFQVLGNSLARNPVQRIAVVLGALQAAALVVLAFVTAAILLAKPLAIERQGPWVITGALVTLGWVLAPLVVGGAEPTLDPRKLARFPIHPRRILLAELLVGLSWVPAGATFLAALAGVLAWANHPDAALAAIGSAALVVVTCVVASRTATTLAADLVARRGALGRIVATLVAILVMLVPVAVALGLNWPPWEHFEELVTALAFTPLGAAWSIPGFLAEGHAELALLVLVVALATIGVLWLLWSLALDRALRTRGSAGHRLRAGRLGPFAVAPSGPGGAIASRGVVLWFRDSRLVIQLVILPAVPALLVLLAVVERIDWFALVAAPVAAGLLPLAQFAAISYDGTAFSSEVAAAVPGRADRTGRAAALLAVALPVVVLAAVLAPLAVGSPARIPAVLGLSLGALLTAAGVSSISSAIVAVPVPAAGRNPFSSSPGSNTTQVVGSYLVTGAAGVALAPVIVLGAIALATADHALGWATLAVGLLWGAAALGGGIAVGGRILDRTAPELLARLRRIRMR